MTPTAELARGLAYYDAGQFAECAQTLRTLVDRTPSELGARDAERARVYCGACLIATGDAAGADEQFRRAVRENPQMAIPSTVVFPQEVVDRFIVVRTGLIEEIRKAQREDAVRAQREAERARQHAELERQRVAELERLAVREHVVDQNERWVAWVPFGVGQFQNRSYALGGVFLASEVIFAGTAIGASALQLSLHSQANGGNGLADGTEVEQLNRNLQIAHVVSLASLGALVLTAGIGILEANLSFVPEFDGGTRERRVGKKRISRSGVGLAPAVSGGAEGASIGISGRF